MLLLAAILECLSQKNCKIVFATT